VNPSNSQTTTNTTYIIMNSYEYERYVTTKENLKATLEQFGVAIIPNVLNAEEVEAMKSGMWDFLEHVSQYFETPIDRNNSETWKEFLKLIPLHSMLVQHWGIGHAQFLWNVRQNQSVLDIMSHFWNVSPDELLVSFDGAGIHMPPEITNRGWFRGAKWLHTDQSYLRNDFECVQSWLTAFDVETGDATLKFLEGSHQYHADFFKRFYPTFPTADKKENDKVKKDFYLLFDDQKKIDFYKIEKKCPELCIKCPSGSMVFWDSRTIHAGQEPLHERPIQNIRCVAYICYTPRKMASGKALEKKRKAFNNLRTTSHWPHKPTLFSKLPRTYGNKLQKITNVESPVTSEIGKKLAGF
jgi:hypothetical protein